MKMKKYIIAGLMAAALLTSGCGKFVRDELINMQNEIDRLSIEVDKLIKSDLSALKTTIEKMANGGFIIGHEERVVGIRRCTTSLSVIWMTILPPSKGKRSCCVPE